MVSDEGVPDKQSSPRGPADESLRSEFDLKAQIHEQRMDLLRHLIALVLVLALFGIVTYQALNQGDLQNVAEATAPVSGLAGIAVGWLFGARSRASD